MGLCYEHDLLWRWSVMNGSVMNVVCYEPGLLRTWSVMNCWSVMGVGRIFSRGSPVGDFPKIFSRGWPKVVLFGFYPSKMKKQPFFANNFKIQGRARPFPGPPSNAHGVCYECGLLWTWSVMNGSVMNRSVMNVVCFEWSVSSGLLCLFWTDTSRNYFTVAMKSNGDSRQKIEEHVVTD